jgi:heme/copper-type cytochrome/quinol oxidase subunit 3
MLLLLLRELALELSDCRVSCIQLFLGFVDVVWDVVKRVVDVVVALLW